MSQLVIAYSPDQRPYVVLLTLAGAEKLTYHESQDYFAAVMPGGAAVRVEHGEFDDLCARGWVAGDGDGLSVTREGRKALRKWQKRTGVRLNY